MYGYVGLPFEVRLIGGPYDGLPGVYWVELVDESREVDLPERLLIGRCPGDGSCGATNCPRAHAFTWDADEQGGPDLPTVVYAKSEVREDEQFAVYVYAVINQYELDASEGFRLNPAYA